MTQFENIIKTELAPWMKEQISKTQSAMRSIAIRIEDIKKNIGEKIPEIRKMSDEQVYNMLVPALWNEGLVITGADYHKKTKKPVIIIREISEYDTIPPTPPYFHPGERDIAEIDAVIKRNKDIIEKTEKIEDTLNVYLKKGAKDLPDYTKKLLDLVMTLKADEYSTEDDFIHFWWD